ncbi:MAG: flavin reductase [Ruminococcus sp.]|nr:flavin reductase [Ruminococcus sp.]
MSFRKIDIADLQFNPFTKIGKEWMLITAGNKDSFNSLTASWGQLGVLWNKNVFTCYIRPTRYTIDFIEREEYLTASFFGEEYRSALSYYGSHSGRDVDKAKETGLTPVEIDGHMTYEQADMVIVCRKLYKYGMEEKGFITDDGLPSQFFSTDPYHKAFISEIAEVYVKE